MGRDWGWCSACGPCTCSCLTSSFLLPGGEVRTRGGKGRGAGGQLIPGWQPPSAPPSHQLGGPCPPDPGPSSALPPLHTAQPPWKLSIRHSFSPVLGTLVQHLSDPGPKKRASPGRRMEPLALLTVGMWVRWGGQWGRGKAAELLPFLGFCQLCPGLHPPQLPVLQRGREGFQIRIYGINGFFLPPPACLPHCKPHALPPGGGGGALPGAQTSQEGSAIAELLPLVSGGGGRPETPPGAQPLPHASPQHPFLGEGEALSE